MTQITHFSKPREVGSTNVEYTYNLLMGSFVALTSVEPKIEGHVVPLIIFGIRKMQFVALKLFIPIYPHQVEVDGSLGVGRFYKTFKVIFYIFHMRCH